MAEKRQKKQAAMKHIDDDELLELSVRVAGKLESIGDEEYAGLVLEAAE